VTPFATSSFATCCARQVIGERALAKLVAKLPPHLMMRKAAFGLSTGGMHRVYSRQTMKIEKHAKNGYNRAYFRIV
jgi:hypothetical protein